MQLAKLEAKIRQESSQNGRSLPEDQLASYLMGQFEEAMKAIESQVYAKFQTTEDEVKVATEYFEEEEDKDVANAVAKLQELYRVMTGGGFSDVEVPADLTLTKVRREQLAARRLFSGGHLHGCDGSSCSRWSVLAMLLVHRDHAGDHGVAERGDGGGVS